MLVSLKSILNYTIQANDGLIGRIKDIYFDDESWFVKYFVVETGSFIKTHKVVVIQSLVQQVDHAYRTLSVPLDIDDFLHAPDSMLYKPVSAQMSESKKNHADRFLRGNVRFENSGHESASKQPHLRSIREIIGYSVLAFDGPTGRLCDFLAYEECWNIRYLSVGVNKGFHKRKVLISPQSAQRIHWDGKRIEIESISDVIQKSPEYNVRRLYERK